MCSSTSVRTGTAATAWSRWDSGQRTILALHPRGMAPHWLEVLSWISIVAGVVCAVVVLGDIRMGHPQKMKVMEWVWPLTCLYAGPLGLWAYYGIGRNVSAARRQNETATKAA